MILFEILTIQILVAVIFCRILNFVYTNLQNYEANLLLLLFVVPIICASGQNSTVFQDDMNFIYQNVNRTPVATGLLKDYGLLYTNLAKYDGILRFDNYINNSVWNSIYSSLFFMKFNTNATLVSPTQAASTIASFKTYPDGQHPLINIYALHYEYEQFKTNAATSNLVYVSNGKIYDTPNRPTTPYEKKSTFSIAVDTDALDGNHHTFHFRSTLFFKNVNFTVSQFEVDFGDGLGYRVAPMNMDIGVTYPNDGEKTLLFKLSYTNGQVFYSRTIVWVRNTTEIGCVNCRYAAPDRFDFPITTITNPPLAETAVGTATIFYGGTDRILDKPIILAEGFDPFNEFFANSLFDQDFLEVPIDLDFVGQTLEDALSDNGYDLIYVNYANGGAAIKNNAFLLENIIQWVNQRKATNGSTQKNVVMGVSMGGLVARYALRDMELRNINHDTRLYISMDSPQQGANVPLGFQAAVKYLRGLNLAGIRLINSPELDQAVFSLNTPAATQMLTYQLAGQGSSIAVNNTTRTNFKNEYQNLGMPRLWGIRNIAVASGSECGVGQGYAPYTQMLTGNGSKDIGYLANFFVDFSIGPGANPFRFWGGLITTDSDFLINFDIRALPDMQAQRIFYLNISYRKEILFGLIRSTRTIFDFSFNSQASMLPLDSSPGGLFDINQFGTIPTNISIIGLTQLQTKFAFIPTASALDIGSGTQTILTSDLARAYSPVAPPEAPKNVPFNNFFTNPISNEQHIQFTLNNARWMFQEIQGTPAFFSCNYTCVSSPVAPAITGPNEVCNTSAAFTLSNAPLGATITWTHSSILNYAAGQNTPTYSVTRNSSGSATVSATLNGACGNSLQFNKNVRAGGFSSSDYPVFGPSSICKNQTTFFYTNDLTGATGYTWFWPSNWTYLSGQGSRNLNVATTNNSTSGSFGVRVANACDAGGSPATRFIMVNSCGSYFMSYSPNPTTAELNVEVMDEDADQVITGIQLRDQNGSLVKEGKFQSKKITLEVNTLKKGTYYLRVTVRDNFFTERIIIE